jgi:uncharacterized DUF497 family protein
MSIEFELDEAKNRLNRKKHGIWFEEVLSVFDDPLGRLFPDGTDAEDRFILIGTNQSSQLLVLVHCYRNEDSIVRIISARKATKRERNFYEKRV